MTRLAPFPRPTPLSAWPADPRALPPGRYVAHIPVARLLSGHDLALTVHVVRGGDGPCLGLFAGIHGDEIPGVRSLRAVLTAVDTDGLRGTVIAVPVANPVAWGAQRRVTPERDVDRANLARVFASPPRPAGPGDAGGSLARRLAATLERTVYRPLSHLVDYHCYGRDTAVRIALYRIGQAPGPLATSLEMTRAFGLGVIMGVAGSAGTTSAYAADLAIPTCVVELGGTHTHRDSEDAVVRLGTDGALRVMRGLGMIDAAPPAPDRQLMVERTVGISPGVSGYYLPAFDLEDLFRTEYPHGIPVRAGQVLGQLFDTYTLEANETLAAPEDGRLFALVRGGPYQVGGPGLSLAIGQLR